MKRQFDWFGRFVTPSLILCNPSGAELSQISHAKNINMTLRFNGYSELTFDVNKLCDGEEVAYYGLLEAMREIRIDNYGVFVVDTVNDKSDGYTWTKTISCKSKDAIFSTKSIVGYKGTYRLYSPTTTDTILGKLLTMFPDWTIDTIDSELLEVYRTYDVSEQNWYDFLMNDVCEDFNCVFKFNTLEKKISAYTIEKAIKSTDIYVSFDNLLKSIDVQQSSDKIVTALEVYGGDGLSIHGVNPLGSAVMYNYSHYKNTSWISQDTINAITTWENKIKTEQSKFATLLTQQKTKAQELITLKSQLVDLEGIVKGFNEVIGARISAGQSYEDINSQLATAENNVRNKKAEITSKENELKSIQTQTTTISNSLQPQNNFTKPQLVELDSITKQGVYQNDSFIKTSIMSDVEIQDQSQKLYDLATTVLNKLSQPRYTFSGEIVNFFALKEFGVFAEQLELGCNFTISMDGKGCFYPVLLELELDFENIESSSFTFCSDLRPSNSEFDFVSIFEGMQSSISSVNYSKGMWEDYLTSGDKDSFNEFKNNALDLATKDIVANDGQEFTISSYGIRGKKMVDGSLSKNELWITNNCIAMSSDNFTSSRLAIGEITYNGVKTYGIVADAIIGDLIAGKSMVIKNQNNSVVIDGTGITATNASLTLTKGDNSSKVILNPTDGIKIQKNVGGTLQDVFYVDGSGNLTFKGTLSGASGTFSGNLSGASGTFSGTLSGGSIDIGSGNFTVDTLGACRASKLDIIGGTIDLGNGRFTVDANGNVKGTSFTLNGEGAGSVDIKSAKIVGGNILQTDGVIQCEMIAGRLQFHKGGTYIGLMMADSSDEKLWIQGNKAVKIETVSGGISLNASAGNKVYIGDCAFTGSVSGCKVVFG